MNSFKEELKSLFVVQRASAVSKMLATDSDLIPSKHIWSPENYRNGS